MNQLKNMGETKWMMIAFAIIVLLCCCMIGGTYLSGLIVAERMGNMIEGEPTSLAEMRERIAEFDVPPGYEVSAVPMVVYDMLLIGSDNAYSPTITMLQYSSMSLDSKEEIEESLRQVAEGQSSQPGIQMQVVKSFETVIRGETAEVVVSEGNFESLVMRQWITTFTGNNGPVLLMIQGSTNGWDEDLLMDFIRSIR